MKTRPSLLSTATLNFSWKGKWHPLVPGEAAYARRGSIHTFRNSGKTIGRLMIVITPGGFEKYLEEIGPCSPATRHAEDHRDLQSLRHHVLSLIDL
jgi:hypothetical protein